jgi:hypothetical protein
MLLIVAPAGAGAGLGAGLGDGALPPDAPGAAGGGLVGVDGVGEAVEGPGEGLEAVPGLGTVIVVLVGMGALPPHPATATKSAPDKLVVKTERGTKRISRF